MIFINRKRIVLADDSITNLTIGKNALADKYDVCTVYSGEELLKLIDSLTPDLILLDVELPGMDGYEVIKILKANAATAHIPVVFLTKRSDPESEREGLSLGAIDYITKPFSPPLLVNRIELYLMLVSQNAELKNYAENLETMVKEKTQTVLELQDVILKTVAQLVEYRDDITGGHIERIQQYLKVLAAALLRQPVYREELLSWDIEFFLLSSQLHDVGKIAVKDSILQKPGKLTAEEFEEMKEHTSYGVRIVREIMQGTTESAFLEHAEIMAGSHHEKWDGTGYPQGLKGDDIPLQGRMMAIADVYDALISKRPYKKPFTHAEAVKIMEAARGRHFDPYLVDVFVENEKEFEIISRHKE